MAFLIYMATSSLSGGRYIGATSRGLSTRKRQHGWDAVQKRPGCKVLNAAMGIGEMLHGRQSKCGGRAFAYSSTPISERKRKSLLSDIAQRSADSMSRRKSRAVICLSDDTVYPSAVNAAAIYKIASSRVMQLCQSRKATPGGLAFQYADLAEAA